MFKEIAQGLTNLDELMEHVQQSLADAVDSVIEASMSNDAANKPVERLAFHGRSLEFSRDDDGMATVYLVDSEGNRLVSHRFAPSNALASDVCDALGIENAAPAEVEQLQVSMRRMAA